MNMEKICFGCMSDKGPENICPNCGWAQDTIPESSLHLNPGTILKGQYLIGRVLGHGGFGITYLACDINLGTKLAIKEYFPQGMATRGMGDPTISVYSGGTKEHFEYGLEKFMDEARTLSKFDDVPEIVTIKDFFKENGTAYIVMAYIDGVTLKQYTEKNGGKLPLDAGLNIMLPVMKALEHVHKAGILHRDISPDNIYITSRFGIKLLDFGAARFAIGEHSKSLSVLLKPGYAPEEQYRTKGKQGPWTDIYAVAATMYKILTGETPPEALDRLEEDTLIPPSKQGVSIPYRMEEALLKALSIRAADRYQTMPEFYQAFQATAIAEMKANVRENEKPEEPVKNEELPNKGEMRQIPASEVKAVKLQSDVKNQMENHQNSCNKKPGINYFFIILGIAIIVSITTIAIITGSGGDKNNIAGENLPIVSVSKNIVTTSTTEVNQNTLEGTLSFWHFNKDEAPFIEEAFKKEFPNVELDITVIPDRDNNYLNECTLAIRSGAGLPDLFSAESAFVKRLVEMPDGYADITEKTREVSADMAKYTIDIGTDSNGVVRALSHQVTPGGIGYKKAVASKYLGTDNADEIAAMLSSQEKILETAEKLKKASDGKVALFQSWEEMRRQFLGGRSAGWVVDGKLNIDRKVLDLIDFSRRMRDNKYEAGSDAWSPRWTSAIRADEEAMCWTIPTWGVPWIIGSNDPKAKDGGRWGFCKGPFAYSWGGTWYGISSKTKNPELAWEFIKWRTSDKEHLREWSIKTGDVPNSMSLISEFAADSIKDDEIMGTNLFKYYSEIVGDVNGSTYTQYDDIIENAFNDVMKSYLEGKVKSNEEVLSQFKRKVKQNIKDITVE